MLEEHRGTCVLHAGQQWDGTYTRGKAARSKALPFAQGEHATSMRDLLKARPRSVAINTVSLRT